MKRFFAGLVVMGLLTLLTVACSVEAHAPKVIVQFNGDDSRRIGPFNTTGTFHFYCTVHQGMKLTVIVQ